MGKTLNYGRRFSDRIERVGLRGNPLAGNTQRAIDAHLKRRRAAINAWRVHHGLPVQDPPCTSRLCACGHPATRIIPNGPGLCSPCYAKRSK